jgi:hypothetical protein
LTVLLIPNWAIGEPCFKLWLEFFQAVYITYYGNQGTGS